MYKFGGEVYDRRSSPLFAWLLYVCFVISSKRNSFCPGYGGKRHVLRFVYLFLYLFFFFHLVFSQIWFFFRHLVFLGISSFFLPAFSSSSHLVFSLLGALLYYDIGSSGMFGFSQMILLAAFIFSIFNFSLSKVVSFFPPESGFNLLICFSFYHHIRFTGYNYSVITK